MLLSSSQLLSVADKSFGLRQKHCSIHLILSTEPNACAGSNEKTRVRVFVVVVVVTYISKQVLTVLES